MITKLSVSNYALIERLELNLKPGFTTLTGETGAGKSILLGALGLCTGQRADVKTLKNPDVKCVVELFCDLSKLSLKSFFEENDLDYEVETIIRREILPSGKSRAFVNDVPTRLDVVVQLSKYLVDIHSQGDTLLLNKNQYALDLLDSMGELEAEVQQYQKAFHHLKEAERKVQDIKGSQQDDDIDYLTFQLNELSALQISETEAEEMESTLEQLQNAESIQESLSVAHSLLDDESRGAMTALRDALFQIQSIERYSTAAGELAKRLESSRIELEDISSEIQELSFSLDTDPQTLQQLTEKWDLFQTLLRKHKVETRAELQQVEEQIADRVHTLSHYQEKLQEAELEKARAHQSAENAAVALHQARQKAIPQIEGPVSQYLTDLNMGHSEFVVDLRRSEELKPSGGDELTFMFSANPGSALKPLSKVASGGEMSRVMLALKAISAQAKTLPTIIFDEIDTGISGETAEKMARILKRMGREMQVLAITHLPQIASSGFQHLKVEKTTHESDTTSTIFPLVAEKRVEEIARMLSGVEMTEAALKNAEQLLESAK
ncbi:MAG: DNA repair protein RecN [Schleiferiaceae bacterium]